MPDDARPRLILVLGDQLTRTMPQLMAGAKDRDVVVMAELSDEAAYADHHRKKLVFCFSAMRHFAKALEADGWTVDYTPLTEGLASFEDALRAAISRHDPCGIVATEPGEWRLQQAMEGWEEALGLPVKIFPDRRFLSSRAEFADWARGRKALRMEHFYREMRRAHGILMDGDQPAGGKWNYDSDNREAADPGAEFPGPLRFDPDKITEEVLAMVEDRFPDRFGDLRPFWFAVTAEDAEKAADHFFAHALAGFGDVQDAMLEGEAFLNHSVLAQYLNAGLLDPLVLCRRAEAAWEDGKAPLNAAEGFIRQILGWREYVRGIYFLEGPDYVGRNELEASRDLPWFYWSGETDMACLKAAVEQTQAEAYAHHIQRLMVLGNFALVAGVEPRQLHEWFLAVYADAYEWVEAPNVVGMSQFADGGLLGSKPYAASGAYIDRMSNHCAGCRYDVKKKFGEGCCPFNPLYWDFMLRHRERFKGNGRVSRAYATWDRMAGDKRDAYLSAARHVLGRLDAGERV
ncbi:cryptochrome/photolyase family protein [Rhodovulum sp. DZ06]|uniref:cryptochrome/photolyase family protein n=1 Tax=Rhodovulum sp. DZ06 TaxID=3425126 RepID=UPI003D34A3E0